MDLDETTYRARVDETLRRLDAAFEKVDPDLAESEYAQGTLVIIFRQTYKLIVSPQAPLKQLWVAFRDRAWHFDLVAAPEGPSAECWADDRGQGVELLRLVADLTKEHAGVALTP